MTSVLFILIVLYICYKYGVVGSGKKKASQDKPNRISGKSDGRMSDRPGSRIMRQGKHDGICQAARVKKSGLDALGLEDRENDWLARQLREEAKLKSRMYSDMAALKQEHLSEHRRINGI